jgi:hypothetical protein
VKKNSFGIRLASVLICFASFTEVHNGISQVSTPTASEVVRQIMTTALSRCYSNIDGVKRITFEPATSDEFAKVKALGEAAVAPLAEYIDLKSKNGFTQLFAVKFLIALGGTSTWDPLKRALDEDQWEVTRAQALAGLYQLSPSDAKPYVHALLKDGSPLVRQRANDLWQTYMQ